MGFFTGKTKINIYQLDVPDKLMGFFTGKTEKSWRKGWISWSNRRKRKVSWIFVHLSVCVLLLVKHHYQFLVLSESAFRQAAHMSLGFFLVHLCWCTVRSYTLLSVCSLGAERASVIFLLAWFSLQIWWDIYGLFIIYPSIKSRWENQGRKNTAGDAPASVLINYLFKLTQFWDPVK